MVTYGAWQNDSVPVWVSCGTRSTDQSGWRWSSYASNTVAAWDADPRMSDSWNGTGDNVPAPDAGVGHSKLDVSWNQTNNAGNPIGSRSSWMQFWLTLTRYDPNVTSGTLPASVYDYGTGQFVDPTVTGVEWEPATGAALAQRLQVALQGGYHYPADQPIYVKQNAQQQPAFMSGASVAAIADLAVIPAGSTFVTVDNPPIAAQGADAITVGLVDAYTQAQALPALPSGQTVYIDIDLPCDLKLEGQYAPRYRLIYGSPVRRPAYNRILQRGNDGLGASGGRRIIQARTIQSTNRRGSAIR